MVGSTFRLFFVTVATTAEIYTLSLHDALPIFRLPSARPRCPAAGGRSGDRDHPDRKSTRLNSSHVSISYAVFCLKKKKVLARRAGRFAGCQPARHMLPDCCQGVSP